MKVANIVLPAALAVLTTPQASAQPSAKDAGDYPARAVRLVIPFTAGGGNDIVARTVAQKLSELWGQQVISDNRTGANGIIGTDIVAKASPDGYTLVIASTSFTMNPAQQKLPFDPVRDFAPIGLVAEGALIFTAHPSFPARDIPGLIKLAKARPGKLQYATSGQGGITHLAAELFQKMAGISLVLVPYKGSSAAAIDVIGGQVPVMVSSVSPALPYLQSGRLRALGIGSPKRSSLLPQVPTVAEQGVAGYDTSMWWGIMAPAKTPPGIVARINRDINRGLDSDEVRERIARLGMSIVTSPEPAQFSKLVASDIAKWGRIIKDMGPDSK
jgi:tripartite-type tricarboxylate transporter receptor subunit TctC